MTFADNSPYNANTKTFLIIIKLYANDIIVRIHIKIAFSSKVTMNEHGKNLYASNITTSVTVIVSCAHNIMVSEGNIVAFPLNIIMTAQDIIII